MREIVKLFLAMEGIDFQSKNLWENQKSGSCGKSWLDLCETQP